MLARLFSLLPRSLVLRVLLATSLVGLVVAGGVFVGPRVARRVATLQPGQAAPAPIGAPATGDSARAAASAAAAAQALDEPAPSALVPGRVPEQDQPPTDQHLAMGELSLQITANPWHLSVLDPAHNVLWEEPLDQSLGFTTSEGHAYRATRLVAAAQLTENRTVLVAATDDPAGRRLLLEAKPAGSRAFRITLAIDGNSDGLALQGAAHAANDEHFVGFGERFTGVDQRGKKVDVWAEDRVVAQHGASTYAPLPLLMSSRGYGLALEAAERSQFDLAAERTDRWTWRQAAPTTSLLVTYGPSLSELVQRHAALSGLPPVPPAWAFGVWKAATGGQDHVLEEAGRLRELGVPVSAIFAYDTVDEQANIGWPSVNYAGRWAGPYPDPAAYTDALHGLGFKALTYAAPDFHTDRGNYDEPASKGLLVRNASGQPYVHPGFLISWLDVSQPAAVAWWAERWHRTLNDLGYDGAMLDLGELLPADARLADGTPGSSAHNRYPLLYARAAWLGALAARPDGDFVLFARSGAFGAQRFQSLQWPGDPRMRWDAPDGLQSLLPAALSMGLGGFPYWHPEVAGYVQAGLDPTAERELWLRWLQFATWSPTLRDHYGDHPNNPVDMWKDASTIAAYRDAARIHSQLWPYLYTQAVEAGRTGLPLMRYLPLETPDDPRAWREEQSYFLGPDLLVAPVIEPGATTRTLYLPRGRWADFWTDTVYEGGQDVSVPAPLDGGHAPVFIRAGALLPLATEFDSLVPGATSDGPLRTYDGDLVVRVAAGGDQAVATTLYDGTRLDWDGAATLRVTGSPRPRTVTLRVPGRRPVSLRVDGAVATLDVR